MKLRVKYQYISINRFVFEASNCQYQCRMEKIQEVTPCVTNETFLSQIQIALM